MEPIREFVPRKLPQLFAASVASIAGIALGATLTWPSPCIPSMDERGDFGTLSADTKTWIASIVSLGALAGGPVAGFGIEKFGRRFTLLALCIPFLASSLVVAFSESIAMLLAGRFFSGFFVGMATLAAPAYIAEIASPDVRGVLGSIFNAMLTFGTVATFILGVPESMHWKWISYIHSGIPVLLFLGMLTVPESPIYLLIKRDVIGARRSLAWLRGASHSDPAALRYVNMELQTVQHRLLAMREAQKRPESKVGLRDLFRHGTWQPTLLALALVFYNQMSGITAMLSYSNTIVKSTNINVNPNWISAILGSIAIVSTVIMDKAGRRTLLMISDAGMAIGLAVVGLFFYLESRRSEEEGKLEGAITWMPLAALVVYNTFYNVGLGPLPRVVSTEILPQRVKGLTLTISLSLNWILAFAVTKTFSNIQDALKLYGFFWLYAGVCLSGVLFVFVFVPETRGKTFAEIEGIWVKKQKQELLPSQPLAIVSVDIDGDIKKPDDGYQEKTKMDMDMDVNQNVAS